MLTDKPNTDELEADKFTKVAFRGAKFQLKVIPGLALLAFVALLAFWQLGSVQGWVPSIVLPAPLEIGQALWQLIISGELWQHLGASLQRLVLGWSLGTVCGLFIGALVGLTSVGRAIGVPFISAFFAIPKIALLPLFIIWFGIGEPSKVATIAFGVFFPTVIYTYSGIDMVPRNLIQMGLSFNLKTQSIVSHIIFPGALPNILAGCRISASIGIILLVAAEMIGAEFGVGALILAAGNLYQIEQLLAGVMILSMLGLTVSSLITRIERRLLRWR
ncbi:MAG: ABC-type nitrate/sulfonate/bicarbonate transport system permease component [Oceanospirillaceae bacterium]|jgi:ABC-type nitrate/sulfonate/bicarbonate transport system permease component